MTIAILGASGHISKCVFYCLSKTKERKFHLYSRNPVTLGDSNVDIRNDYENFMNEKYDVIINGIGVGNSIEISRNPGLLWRVTEDFDNMIMSYHEKYPETLSIHFSSGAAYGTEFNCPVDETSKANIPINSMTAGDFYTIAKLHSEAKHRSYTNFNIVDIRIFGFFSRFIDLEYPFLLCDIINALKNKTVLTTNSTDIFRDYIHPEDFSTLLEDIINQKNINQAIDARSAESISKFKILNYFSDSYGLITKTIEKGAGNDVSGQKPYYFSNRKNPWGNEPKFTSFDCIRDESKYLL